jgi:integrase
MLEAAVDWDVIPEMPVRIKQLEVTTPEMDFFDFDEYEQLVAAAKRFDPRNHIMVLLGGDTGLRPGEIRALRPCEARPRGRSKSSPALDP